MNAASGTHLRGQESPRPDAPRACRRPEPPMAAKPAMHAARRVQRSRAADGDKPSPTLRFLFLFIFNRSRYEKSESSAPQCYPRIGDMQTPPKSRSPSAFHAFLHIVLPHSPLLLWGGWGGCVFLSPKNSPPVPPTPSRKWTYQRTRNTPDSRILRHNSPSLGRFPRFAEAPHLAAPPT